MKLSKKYPVLNTIFSNGEKMGKREWDEINKRVGSGTPMFNDLTKFGFEYTNYLIGIKRAVKWYEPCESLLRDALDSYPKLFNLSIAPGTYIITGNNLIPFDGWFTSLTVLEDQGWECATWCKTGLLPVFMSFGVGDSRNMKFFHVDDGISPKLHQEQHVHAALNSIKATVLFAQHCGTEAKEMMTASIPKKRTTLRKVINDLGIKRIRLTASWYRDTVQGHPFMVSGHWRKQRHGEGLKKVKRKFITPYMKDGYRSKPQRDNVE